MSSTVQVRDRKFKPLAWDLRSGAGVAPDCQWALRGLVQGWPMWSGKRTGDPRHLVKSATGPQTLVGGKRGQMMRSVTGNAQMAGLARVTPLGPGCTVVIHYRKTDATNRAVGGFGMASVVGTDRIGTHLPYSDGVVYWDFGGSSVGTTRLSVSGLTFGDDVWAFTTGLRGMEIWQNGVLRASNSATPTRTQGLAPWGPFAHATTGSDNADCGILLLYNRQLSEWEIRQLSRDPWIPFRPARRPAFRTGALSTTSIRATQAVIEALISTANPSLRISQAVVEVLIANAGATAGSLRVTQALAEVLTLPTPSIRATQIVAEALVAAVPALVATQAVAEVLVVPTPALQVTQAVLEVLVKVDALTVSQTGLLYPRGSVPPF